MNVRLLVLAGTLVFTSPAWPQSPAPGGMPPPPGMSLAQSAAMRFPQPVRVGDLLGRAVIEPVEAQTMLGRVRALVHDSVRDGGGTVLVIIELSQWFGLQSRTVAVPLDGMVLLGDVLEPVVDTRAQLWQQPVFDLSSATRLGDDATVRIGLAKPSH